MTAWGVARATPRSLPAGVLWERQFADQAHLVARRRPQTLFAGFEFIHSTEADHLWELQSILMESCRKWGSIACVINAPRGGIGKWGTDTPLKLIMRRWKNEGPCPLYFDFGRSTPPSNVGRAWVVSDPLWENGTIRGNYWRIHGWHPERWVRLYSEAALHALAQKAKRHRPLAVVLNHSQRLAQIQTLRGFDHLPLKGE